MFLNIRTLFYPILILAVLTACAGLEKKGSPGPSVIGAQAAAVVQGCGPHETGFKPGPLFSEELQKKVASEIIALEGRPLTIPITMNEDVQAAMEFFLGDARGFMTRSLVRSGKYLDMMKKTFRDKGLPEDLAYLSLIESGFRVEAYSPAHAAGLWQFIPATGKRYGLKIDEWADERLHPEKSTRAAADYLADLHQIFGCWYLATAAYNAGEGKILKALKRYKATDFWTIAGEDYLRAETKDYVPKLLAAILIAKEPAVYGLTDITPQKPQEVDEVVLPYPTDLAVIARLVGTDTDTVQTLNPHLKLWCTPLDERNYPVRIPKGGREAFLDKYARLESGERLKSSAHKVKGGETLATISRLYGIPSDTLKNFNGLRSTRLKRDQMIRIPVGADEYQARQKAYQTKLAAQRAELEKMQRLVYTVRSGDNPWMIGMRFDLNWKDIAAWNDIKDVTKLMPGQKLVLYLDKSPAEEKSAKTQKSDSEPAPAPKQVLAKKAEESASAEAAAKSGNKNEDKVIAYKVKEGENLWKISRRFEVEIGQIRAWNGLKDNRIGAGQTLKIMTAAAEGPAAPEKSPPKSQVPPAASPAEKKISSTAEKISAPEKKTLAGTYTVQPDDTLWKISRKFNLDPDQIRVWNGMKDNTIQPGQVLKIASSPEPQKTTPAEQVGPEGKTTQVSQSRSRTGGKVGAVSYTVQSGDTLWKISRRFRVDPVQIRAWNEMKDDSIRPGDVLLILADQT